MVSAAGGVIRCAAAAIVVAAIAGAWLAPTPPDFSWINEPSSEQCLVPPRWAETYFYQFLTPDRPLKGIRILVNDDDGRPMDPTACGIDVIDGGDVLIVTRRKGAVGASDVTDDCKTATVRLAWVTL